MAALKEVRKRIKTVRGIEQVTNAMKMVATVKIRRIESRLLEVRPYAETLYAMAGKLASTGNQTSPGSPTASGNSGAPLHPLLVGGEVGPEILVVIGSDRGLCGAFNMGLLRQVNAVAGDPPPEVVLVGHKVGGYFARQRFRVVKSYARLEFPVGWAETEAMARDLVAVFGFGGHARIRLVYQKYVSPGVSRTATVPWLPFVPEEGQGTADLKCEPSVEAVLETVLPRALTAQLYQALLESQASEQGARMVAMDNATRNAAELASDLTLLANKLRQTGITKELLEISTGVEAMNN